MRMLWCACILASAIAVTTAAQDKPDFSGRWVLVNLEGAAPEVARELVVRESFEARVAVLAVERRSGSQVRSDRYSIGIVGGTVAGVAEGEGRPSTRTTVSTRWDGNRLMIETGNYSGTPGEPGLYSERDEVWSLDAQGRLVLRVTDRGSGREPRTTELTYRRP